jgi:hypothetical protein
MRQKISGQRSQRCRGRPCMGWKREKDGIVL